MTIDEYQKAAARTLNYALTEEQQEMHALHLLSAETGEIHGLFQKVYQGHKLDNFELAKEIGDLLWAVAELCTAREWSMEEICRLNIDKLKKRYPDGFSAERSINREE